MTRTVTMGYSTALVAGQAGIEDGARMVDFVAATSGPKQRCQCQVYAAARIRGPEPWSEKIRTW